MNFRNYNYAEGKNPPLSSAERFWVVYLIILIVGFTTVFMVKHYILKSQIEQGVYHFSEEYCGVKLKKVKVHIDYSLFGEDHWRAKTVPDIKGVWGVIDYDNRVTLSSEACLRGQSLDLDKTSRRFFDNLEPREYRGMFYIDLTGFFRFIFFIFIGLIIRFCMVAYRDRVQAMIGRKYVEHQEYQEQEHQEHKRMRGSTKFVVPYLVCVLLAIPGYQVAVNKGKEWRIESAVKDYVLKECGIELKEIDVHVDFMSLPGPFVVGKDWRGTSVPDVGKLRGILVNRTITFDGACGKSDPYLLKLEGTQFMRSNEDIDSTREGNPGRNVLFTLLICYGALRWIYLRRLED